MEELHVSWLQLDVNYSAFTLEDLDHPLLNRIYCIYWDVILVLTTAFFVLMLYTIIKKSSPEMGGYKWYLVHQLCWSYIFDLYMGLWKPIPLWPFHLGYSAGIFSQLSSNFSFVPFAAVTFFAAGMGFGIFIAVLHRYVHGMCLFSRGIEGWVRTKSSFLFPKEWIRLSVSTLHFCSTEHRTKHRTEHCTVHQAVRTTAVRVRCESSGK